MTIFRFTNRNTGLVQVLGHLLGLELAPWLPASSVYAAEGFNFFSAEDVPYLCPPPEGKVAKNLLKF